eukprot:5502949-Pleurochrysis_carterae.AAC.1
MLPAARSPSPSTRCASAAAPPPTCDNNAHTCTTSRVDWFKHAACHSRRPPPVNALVLSMHMRKPPDPDMLTSSRLDIPEGVVPPPGHLRRARGGALSSPTGWPSPPRRARARRRAG